MENIKFLIASILIVVISFIFGFIEGIRNEKKRHIVNDDLEIVRVDTIRVTDTIIKPIPQYIKTIRTDTIYTPKDTVLIPIEQKHYITNINNDSVKGQIKAIISGFNASLDSLQYNIHFEQKTLLKRKKWGWNVSLGGGIGYDIRQRQFEPVVALTFGFGYNIK